MKPEGRGGGQAVEALSVLARTLSFPGDRKPSVFKVLTDFLLPIFSYITQLMFWQNPCGRCGNEPADG